MIRGISGGERKRLSIAVELISFPSVVFLDEPTSGLDSKIAADVCHVLKDIAKTGCTIVASIHFQSHCLLASSHPAGCKQGRSKIRCGDHDVGAGDRVACGHGGEHGQRVQEEQAIEQA